MDKPGWEIKAQAAFDKYLADLKATLPPDASFQAIEQAMLKHSPEMMQKTAEALANAEAFSPREERNT